ncbi:unnamed protein product [Spirodela intermedia]|uniref:Uncharacterized protein n=1 Tax=Spirodela intermedia TaxID=51605 RepID=A0A7I8JDW1_SPIIN|nr:unnamed protein product [Spirodela intermedia]CAA6667935.1 unnamed protein product [Spirodela intermedia]
MLNSETSSSKLAFTCEPWPFSMTI